MTEEALRLITALLGGLASGLLLWRLVAHWPDTTVLVHVLGLLLVASVVLGAVVNLVDATNHAPDNPVVWLMLLHRVACILVALMWPVWAARTRPPHRRPVLTA